MKKNLTLGTVVAIALLFGTAGYAQRPEVNIDPQRHANLAAAQGLIQQAWDKLSLAQQANEFDMEGHAVKAKQLLEEADREVKRAAMTANLKH